MNSDTIAGLDRPGDEDDAPLVTPGGLRAEAIKRLQIGIAGLAAMILLVGLANIIMDRAKETEKTAVPEAMPTIAIEPTSAPNKDPLADAGVVPEMPVATATPTAAPQGTVISPAAQP